MVERIFIIDSHQPKLDAAAARRQFSLSMAVGLAVLAAAAVVQLQSALSPHIAARAQPVHAQTVEYALAPVMIDRN
jgi:hypothetical protein